MDQQLRRQEEYRQVHHLHCHAGFELCLHWDGGSSGQLHALDRRPHPILELLPLPLPVQHPRKILHAWLLHRQRNNLALHIPSLPPLHSPDQKPANQQDNLREDKSPQLVAQQNKKQIQKNRENITEKLQSDVCGYKGILCYNKPKQFF